MSAQYVYLWHLVKERMINGTEQKTKSQKRKGKRKPVTLYLLRGGNSFPRAYDQRPLNCPSKQLHIQRRPHGGHEICTCAPSTCFCFMFCLIGSVRYFRPISLARVITLMTVLQVVIMKPFYVCNRSVLPLLHRVLNNRQDMKCMQK